MYDCDRDICEYIGLCGSRVLALGVVSSKESVSDSDMERLTANGSSLMEAERECVSSCIATESFPDTVLLLKDALCVGLVGLEALGSLCKGVGSVIRASRATAFRRSGVDFEKEPNPLPLL